MVALIIPNSLYGSMIGALINKLIPPIIADVCIIVLLSFFSTKFFLKLKGIIEEERKAEQEVKSTNELPLLANSEDNSEKGSQIERESSAQVSLSQKSSDEEEK